jgi:hypothetical protein
MRSRGIVAGALSSNPKIAIAREVHDMYDIGCRLRKRDRDRFPINREMNAEGAAAPLEPTGGG